MKVWLMGVGSLFALVEFYRWLENFAIPLPVYIVSGVCLAIASNSEYGHKKGKLAAIDVEEVQGEEILLSDSIQPAVGESLTPAEAADRVSFKIDKPGWKQATKSLAN